MDTGIYISLKDIAFMIDDGFELSWENSGDGAVVHYSFSPERGIIYKIKLILIQESQILMSHIEFIIMALI